MKEVKNQMRRDERHQGIIFEKVARMYYYSKYKLKRISLRMHTTSTVLKAKLFPFFL